MTSIASSNSFASFLNPPASNATVNQTKQSLTPDVISALQNKRESKDVTVVFGPNGQSWTV
jgi:hypothetical protein